MYKTPTNRAAVIVFSLVLGAAAPTAADEYYDGIDINQRIIDGQREPINKYLLKRRDAAQRPDPGATGTINRPVKPPPKNPATNAQP
ncbi:MULTISPECIES: hypothetical protein [Sinorhizobium]|uniref:Uncharacterized protein n=1 Tax=Sinorhizobium americanum TaxID=194963 RepID=A0A2S3YV38_9HYPH|nr:MULTISPECIES: hypothetical protein [Sinorhizobium]PDT39567.1 hypothetical protein CO656_20330 [Sinorhizobium sp. FG01]PDT51358.1 hypothetical protein CO664_21610 [Sinorhizobium sp. NG07B]POH26009.1 hypothetical protein ATY30_26020 [Sinorhizobium americanum]POH35494.1 hypothetical protein ATY31_01395 [Sinorhizobium americanum]